MRRDARLIKLKNGLRELEREARDLGNVLDSYIGDTNRAAVFKENEEEVIEYTKIADLEEGMENITIKAKVIAKGSEQKGDDWRFMKVVVEDDTGKIDLMLWGEEIEKIDEFVLGNDHIITPWQVKKYKGDLQLAFGKFGKVTALQRTLE